MSASASTNEWSRRIFLTTMGLGAGAVALGGALSACGGASGGTGPSAGKPVRGGTLRFGAAGGTQADTLDGQAGIQATDWARSFMLYDGLTRLDNSGQVVNSLAESIEPNADATQWTIRVRQGVTTHQGKSFGARDILFSLKHMVDGKLFPSYGLGPVDLAKAKVVDDRTLLLPFETPFSVLPQALSTQWCVMYPEHWDPKKPDGTGPFVFESFTPGVQSTFTRNPSYWGGEVYLDAIVTTNIADENAQLNALRSGQVDVISNLSASSMSVLKSGGYKVTSSPTGSLGLFTMRVDQPPFDEVRVRQALRLVVDRPQMLEQVFGGHGSIGTDVLGVLDPLYDRSLPQRERDLDQAKSLLAQAGASDLSFDLVTAPAFSGAQLAAQVFATQAKDAGVSVNIVTQTATDYYAKSYGKVAFSQDFWQTTPYLINAGLSLAPGADGPFNPTHFDDHEYNALYAQAVAELDHAKQAELAHRMQKIEYDRGSQILPYYFPQVDACGSHVHGIEPSKTGFSPNGYYWSSVWMTR